MEITFEQIKELMPGTVQLCYVDYTDSLDDYAELLQKCIHEGSMDSLYEKIDEAWIDAPFYAFEYLDQKLKSDIMNEFDLDIDEAEELFDKYEDYIRDEFYNSDDSNVVKDLLRNTADFCMFYDTGYYVPEGAWSWNKSELNSELKFIKKTLGIKEKTWDSDIKQMILQASYGGQLVIYFYDSIDDYLELSDKLNRVEFSDFALAIIDTGNGSGDHCHLGGCTVDLPFNRQNIFLDRAVSYSYTYEVCGMSSNWCNKTKLKLYTKVRAKKAKIGSMNDEVKREETLNATFASGKCTIGDMKYSRHRNTVYINDFPCGTKCLDCGTFWID